jgi:hypothetical protein
VFLTVNAAQVHIFWTTNKTHHCLFALFPR